MKLLLTSAGLTNETLKQALRDMLDRPTIESNMVVIPTAHNPEPGDKTWVLQEDLAIPFSLGWKSFGIVDLAAVASLDHDFWWSQLEAADAILIGGGNTLYLSYWMQKTGLFDALPAWLESKVYVGISAGSQIVGSDLYATSELMEQSGTFEDVDYDDFGPVGQSSSKTLKLTNFTFRPHLNSPNAPKIRVPYLEALAKTLKTPMYALDDDCAIQIIDDKTEVVGTGEWHLFNS